MSIIKLLKKKLDRIIFTTPSHSQKPIFSRNFEDFYKMDYSEIEGFDNLQNPSGEIKISQAKVSEILKSKQTFFVTQGATTAILSAMKTLIEPGDRVLVARNCHKSVYNGLILTAGIVDWFMPEADYEWGIYTTIDVDKLDATLDLNHYKVFIMTNPTYEGNNSDIEAIAKVCKKHKTYLMVDEAHGSLYNFSDKLPKTALAQGADVTINSLHKTAGGLNQCALLNISYNIRDIEIEDFQKALNIFQTTSPSYPLLFNIEECLMYLNSANGKKEIENLLSEIEKTKQELKRFGVEFYENENYDPTKMFIRKSGISGYDLSESLFNDFSIEDELNNQIGCLFLTGIGTTKTKIEKLKNALKKISTNPSYEFSTSDFQPHPVVKLQPVDAYNRKYIYISKNDCLLKISNKMLIPYPPGIGILYPGEAIQKWHLDYLPKDVEVLV